MPKFELPKLTGVEVPRPVYAGAGVAGLAVEAVKEYVDTITASAQAGRGVVSARVAGYREQVAGFEPKTFAGTVRSKATAFYKETASEALETYAGLAERGELFVAKLRGETAAPAPVVKKTPAKTAPAVKKAAAEKAPAAKKAPAKKSATARTAPAAKKAPAKKA